MAAGGKRPKAIKPHALVTSLTQENAKNEGREPSTPPSGNSLNERIFRQVDLIDLELDNIYTTDVGNLREGGSSKPAEDVVNGLDHQLEPILVEDEVDNDNDVEILYITGKTTNPVCTDTCCGSLSRGNGNEDIRAITETECVKRLETDAFTKTTDVIGVIQTLTTETPGQPETGLADSAHEFIPDPLTDNIDTSRSIPTTPKPTLPSSTAISTLQRDINEIKTHVSEQDRNYKRKFSEIEN
ncbi:hypothetical protein HDU76_003388, partial [Blyttiomyces sp. JEL0837]